jgi:hypothetical protein
MRAGSLARWCARTAVAFALGVAALAIAAGPAAAEEPGDGSAGSASPLETDWGTPSAGPNQTFHILETDWG